MLSVGLVGYSQQAFDEKEAKKVIKAAFDYIEKKYKDPHKCLVSGLTDLGIPRLGYEEAKKRGWLTSGVACRKAHQYKVFPVDEEVIVGSNWGDESETFIELIDVLVKIGGGKQAESEARMAKRLRLEVIEKNLEAKVLWN